MARRFDTPPTDLDRKSKTLWRRLIAALTEQGTWNEKTDLELLERYVRALEAAREARETLRGVPRFVEGSQGQLVPHPAVKMLRDAELDAERFAASLLLTPAARRRADVRPGEAVGDLDSVL